MKRLIALILSCSIFITGCTVHDTPLQDNITSEIISEQTGVSVEESVEEPVFPSSPTPTFNSLDDPEFHRYLEDDVYAQLVDLFDSDDYFVEDVQARYLSKEYLEELEYNSQENIFFGYALSDLVEALGDTKYIFTLGDDGQTTIKPFEEYDDTFDKVIKDVAIGTGVILLCVTVSIVTAGVGAPEAVTAIFVASAKTGAISALTGSLFGGVTEGIVTGIETGNMEAAKKAALLGASDAYKWGAISGAVIGGAGKALTLKAPSTRKIPSPREAEKRAVAKYGGKEQLSFLNGKEVPYGTEGATRPDIIREIGGKLEAIEIKDYDLENHLPQLCRELERQVSERVANLPADCTQRIVLNTQGRGYSKAFTDYVIQTIQKRLESIYPNIPIDIMA